MKKPLWMKFIIFVVVFMTTISSILPTKVVRADDTSTEIETGWKTYIGDGKYHKPAVRKEVGKIKTYECIENYSSNGYIYYIKDGKKIVPEQREDGSIYFEQGEEYTYKQYWNDYEGNIFLLTEGTSAYENTSVSSYQDDASLVESMITRMILILGAGVYAVACLVIGEQFSIEKVLFNDYTNTQLDFFQGAKTNEFMQSANIKEYLTEFYNFFSKLAFVAYLIILVYMGIRIMLGATAERGAKYKELAKYWLEGIIILFIFPAVMKYSIEMNNAFVSFLGENKTVYMPEFEEQMPQAEEESGTLADVKDLINNVIDKFDSNNDYMSKMFKLGWNNGWLVYAICWYVMFIQFIGFLVVYFRRVLIIMFLIAIFPLVMISYAIDKIRRCKITSI
jgi:hypothetical protein